MKFNRLSSYTGILLLIVGLGVSPLCQATESNAKTSIEAINKQTRELLQSLKSYSAEQSEEAIRETRVALEKVDKRIEELDRQMADQWDQMDQAARDSARTTLNALRRQRTQVAEWYGSLKSSSVGAWGQMKQGFSGAYMALHDAWSKAENEFNTDK